jgi:hypothetical protein
VRAGPFADPHGDFRSGTTAGRLLRGLTTRLPFRADRPCLRCRVSRLGYATALVRARARAGAGPQALPHDRRGESRRMRSMRGSVRAENGFGGSIASRPKPAACRYGTPSVRAARSCARRRSDPGSRAR